MDRASPSFEEVYETELFNMVNLATYFLGSRAMAEEATQDAFLTLHNKWRKVRNPRAFVKRATINRCKDIIKMEQRTNNRRRLFYERESDSSQSHYLVDLLQQLDDKRRFIIVLRFYGGYKIKEIAKFLGLPKGTVESNLHRGIEQLRLLVAEFEDLSQTATTKG